MLAPFKLPLAVFIKHQLKSFSLLQGEFGCWNRTGIVHRCRRFQSSSVVWAISCNATKNTLGLLECLFMVKGLTLAWLSE